VYPNEEVRFGIAKYSVRDLIALIDLSDDAEMARCPCGMLKRKDEFCTECGQR
jgi:hypothetical protein